MVLNLLSVGAAYGVVVALFQWGWGQSLFGFTSTHSIASWLPLFLFLVLFGLSMDYHVFILSRIRESYDRTGQTDQAVAHGIKISAGVVTAAAVIMVFVFLTFATMSMVQLKEMGVGLAVAVLLDATVVRACLLPATMKLLGPRNWYLPRWLGWLPRAARSEPSRRPDNGRRSPWPALTREETVVMDTMRFAVGAAVHAPSVHNTQPWRFGQGDRDTDVYADAGRRLRVADPDGREMMISCGAAVFTLRVALRYRGWLPRASAAPLAGVLRETGLQCSHLSALARARTRESLALRLEPVR